MRTRATTALAIALGLGASSAAAAVSTPHPGITLVTRPGTAMVIADLCAAGVSVRATKYEERKQTPQGWASGIGLAAAVNADFFDFPAATHVQGRARGAGADWPAGTQNVELAQGEVRQYWQFGPQIAALVAPSSTPPAGAATDVVGAHNVIIRNGASLAPDFDGDAVLFGSYRRTAIGISKDHAKLYLFSSNNLMTGAELAAAFLSHAAEGGAPNVDVASNEDGGGSAQLYVAGQGQIVTSGRLVANHLGVYATGTGDAPSCPSRAPIGYLDGADCTHVVGWAWDPDAPTRAVKALLAFDGMYPDPKARYAEAIADADRPDVGKAVGSAAHGFDFPTPYALFDDADHPVLAVGEDTANLRSALLVGSKSLRCKAAPPKSLKRHVGSAEIFAAWKFSAFVDVLPLADAALAEIPEASAIDAPPALVRGDDGAPEVWLVDGGTRRHVTSPASARAWHFDLAAVQVKPAASIEALALGPPLRARPMLAKGSGPAIYLLDATPEETGGDGDAIGDDPTGAPAPGSAASPGAPGRERLPGVPTGGCSLAVMGARTEGPSGLVLFGLVLVFARARRAAKAPCHPDDERKVFARMS